MAENKTQQTKASVAKFIKSLEDETRRNDCQMLVEIMRQLAKAEPVMWGDSIVGFGTYHYRYESGREGDFFLTGFSPRKQNLTLYIMGGLSKHQDLLDKLGKHKTSKGCLYLKRLDDVHLPTLKRLIRESVKQAKSMHKP